MPQWTLPPEFENYSPSDEENGIPLIPIADDQHTDEDEEEEVVMSSPSLPLVKSLIKRIVRASKLLKESKETIEKWPNDRIDSSQKQLSDSKARLFDLLELFHFLWARLLRLLNDEHEHCADLYTQSLNMEDRVPFESLTHAIHRNTKFCDILGEIIDFSYERRPLDDENISEEASAILQRYYSSMVTTQLIATNCGLLVVEGSRESFLDPIAMFDLCKTVASEPARRKRLIPLSLMFSMLDQDDQATAEALAQHIPKILLQRLRHLVHKIFGYPEEKEPGKNDLRSSPHRYRSAAIRSSSRVGSVRASSGTSPVSRSPIAALVEPNQELSSSPLCSPLPVPPGVDTFQSPPQDSRKRVHGRGSSPSKRKWRGIENPFNSHDYDDWSPYVGEKVGRGPGWKNDHQGKNCDFGEVIGLTSNDEVVIKWVPSIDTVHADSAEEHLFRYSFKSPHCEVVSWERFLLSKTMQTDSEGLALQEFLLICAVVGVLCQQRETIVPVLQFQTLESITHVLDSTNLAASFAANEEANDDADLREKRRLAVFEEDGAVDEEKLADFLSWDMDLRAQKRSFREDRELIARVGWVLNALLGHRKLALLFLDGDGVGRILGIIEGPMDVSTIYGCGIVLSHIAKVAVFEEVLRRYENYFLPIMKFVVHHWQLSSSADVQGSVGAFLYHVLSFPRALNFFDESDGPTKTIELLERLLKISEEQFDISSAALQLISLKCMNIYLISHLMLSTKVVFRKHRVLSTLVTKSSPNMSLPRDPATVDAVLGLLSAPSPALPDISADNVQSLLAPERVLAVQALIDKGFHSLLLRCTNYYFVQSRWELLTASLQALCVLTVVPYIRPMIAEPRSNDSGIAQLIVVVNDLSVTYRKGNAFRETHLLPCVIAALQILINITTPPLDVSDEAAVSKFNTSCAAFRASDGVRTLLEVLNIKKDAPMSAKRNYFPVIARAVQLMVTLRRFGDTFSLFEALGVHRVAQELLHQYSSVQKEYISLQREYVSMMGPRKLHAELDPAGRFMDNIQTLIRREARFDLTSDVVKAPLDPMEIEQRQAIVGRAEVDYSRESLLRLIADHLESEGLFESAEKLLEESNLQVGSEGVKSRSDPSLDLDSIVRSYLRLRQENCPNPIETLPLFDLTKKHVYIPPPAPADETRNLFNRLLTRKMCPSPHLRFRTNESCMIYRNPAFMFDITGTGEGLQGECIAFCDDGDTIIIGTSEGAIALFDTFPEEPSEDKLIEQHLVFENESISSLVVSDSGDLIAAVNDARKVKIMPRNSLPVIRCELPECRTVRFSHDSSLLLGTCEEHSCRLFDLGTQQELRQFIDPVWHGDNSDNIALFDGTSQLILNDAVLWDIRCSDSPIVRFDRITESFASTFHPYLPLVIIDEKVWDMRTMKMVQTVPTFQKASSFHVNRIGRAIYSFREASSSTNTANPIVSAVDSYSFEPIFSEEVHPPFKAFALDPSDRYCAAILDQDIESVIRFFSTSSGPFPDVGAFASPVAPDEPESEVDEGDDSEDWSSGDDGSISSSSDDSNEDDHDDQSNFEDEESINTENDDFAELAEHEGSSEEIEESTDVSADSETQSNNST